MKNIFTIILSELNIKYTRHFAEKLYRNTPDRDSFFGLVYMLSFYGIKSKGYHIEENNLENAQIPFVAQMRSGFMLVTSIVNNAVQCVDEQGRHNSIPVCKFLNLWKKNILVFESRTGAEEIDYSLHKRIENQEIFKYLIFLISIFIILLNCIISRFSIFSYATIAYLFLCLLGCCVSWLLIERQWHSGRFIGDKICDCIGKRGCDTVTNSPASKALFGISWSEIGFGYFISTFIMLVLYPKAYFALGIINVFILPYTLWSLWYQIVKVKKGCILCIAVQIILWGLFAIFLFSYNHLYNFYPAHILILPCYGVTILLIHFYSAQIEQNIKQEREIISYRSALCKKEVLLLMQEGNPINITNEDSNILVGNPTAKVHVTIISNPFCGPCTHVHNVMRHVLENNENILVRYLFVSKNESTHFASRYLIGSYSRFGEVALNEWFNMKVQDRKKIMIFAKEIEQCIEAEKELMHHKSFYERNNIKWTPTILINGYIVPSAYAIEDLAYTLFE